MRPVSLLSTVVFLLLASCGGSGGNGGGGEVLLAEIVNNLAGSGTISSPQTAIYLTIGTLTDKGRLTQDLVDGEVGIYNATPGTTGPLATVTAALTDDTNQSTCRDLLSVPSISGSGACSPEPSFLTNKHPSLTGTDLIGATITRYETEITQLDIQSGPPTFAYTLKSVIRIWGTIP